MRAWKLWRVEKPTGEETKFPSLPFPVSGIDCLSLVALVLGRSPYVFQERSRYTSHTRPFVPCYFFIFVQCLKSGLRRHFQIPSHRLFSEDWLIVFNKPPCAVVSTKLCCVFVEKTLPHPA
jgi:hypothetical protein